MFQAHLVAVGLNDVGPCRQVIQVGLTQLTSTPRIRQTTDRPQWVAFEESASGIEQSSKTSVKNQRFLWQQRFIVVEPVRMGGKKRVKLRNQIIYSHKSALSKIVRLSFNSQVLFIRNPTQTVEW